MRIHRWALAMAIALLAGLPAAAPAAHDDLTCDVTVAPSADADTLLSGRSNQTVCLGAGNYRDADDRLQLSSMSHVAVRNEPGAAVKLSGQLRLSSSVNDVRFYGLRLDDRANNSGTETSQYIAGADRILFDRVSVTNGNTNGSCFHTSNADPSQDITVRYSRIYACGYDGEHDHNFYFGKGIRWKVHDNWIYECASRCIATHSASQDALVERNVIAQGCRNHGIPTGAGCSATVLFSESATRAVVRNNTVAYVHNGRWNVDTWSLSGTGNVFADNCLWSAYSDRARNGIDWDTGTVVADPQFSADSTLGYAGTSLPRRNYRIPATSQCNGKEPRPGPVGVP